MMPDTVNPRLKAIRDNGDVTFREDLKKSERWVDKAKEFYEQCGLKTVEYPKSLYADGTQTDIHDFAVCLPREVKRRNIPFHSVRGMSRGSMTGKVGDWAEMVVDMEYHLDRNMRFYNSLPHRYWFWNHDASGVIWLNVEKTIEYWRCKWIFSYGRWRPVVVCPLFWNPRELSPIWTRQELAEYRCGYDEWPQNLRGLLYMTEEDLRDYAATKMAKKQRLWNGVEKRWIDRDGRLVGEKPPKPESR
jgi:hypothetical protein